MCSPPSNTSSLGARVPLLRGGAWTTRVPGVVPGDPWRPAVAPSARPGGPPRADRAPAACPPPSRPDSSSGPSRGPWRVPRGHGPTGCPGPSAQYAVSHSDSAAQSFASHSSSAASKVPVDASFGRFVSTYLLPAGADDERTHAVGILDGEVERDRAGAREADDVRGLLTKVIEQCRDVGSVREFRPHRSPYARSRGCRSESRGRSLRRAATWSSHMRRFATPAWIITTGSPRALRFVVDARAVGLERAALTCHAPMLAPNPDDP